MHLPAPERRLSCSSSAWPHPASPRPPASPASSPSRPNPSVPVASVLSEAALAKAEAALALHVGAVAKALVRRFAPKARTEAELYLLLSDHIEDPAERKAFVRKALSVSGRRT